MEDAEGDSRVKTDPGTEERGPEAQENQNGPLHSRRCPAADARRRNTKCC